MILEGYKQANGATGSRLLSGNAPIFEDTEAYIAGAHKAEAALLYNSGYDANVGFFSCIVGRGDVILYDSYSHASIRDGISLSLANAYKFKHNDLDDLEKIAQKSSLPTNARYSSLPKRSFRWTAIVRICGAWLALAQQ